MAGLPHGQEKSGKNGVFEKSQEEILKISDLLSLNLPNCLYLKAFEC